MKVSEILIESRDFMPVRLSKTEKYPDGIWDSVFDPAHTNEYDVKHPDYHRSLYSDDDVEPPPNPHYKPELNLNLSNSNSQAVIEELGLGNYYDGELDGWAIPIDIFIAFATQWLKKHIGKRDPGTDTVVDKMPGRITIYSGGRSEGYMNEKIQKALYIAKEGKKLGATQMSLI